VEHGAYVFEVGRREGEVNRCTAGRALGSATPALSERYGKWSLEGETRFCLGGCREGGARGVSPV
jgi:hypothetical protein